MRILVETSGGGGIVLVVVAALLAGHGGGLDAAAVAVLIALAVVVALAIGGLVAFLVYRARRQDAEGRGYAPYAVRQVRAEPVPPAVQTPERAALEAPAVRLHPEQLEQLAEIIRRGQRPE